MCCSLMTSPNVCNGKRPIIQPSQIIPMTTEWYKSYSHNQIHTNFIFLVWNAHFPVGLKSGCKKLAGSETKVTVSLNLCRLQWISMVTSFHSETKLKQNVCRNFSNHFFCPLFSVKCTHCTHSMASCLQRSCCNYICLHDLLKRPNVQ